jgi:uncharacterized protein DUF3551
MLAKDHSLEEASMRWIAIVTTALAAMSLSSTGARAQYAPWCAYDVRGGTNCGFYSYAQCMTNLSGIGGYCSRNPASQGSGDRRRQRY